ncbi:MAG: DUF4124 domain-containing protein [Pseudomonadota bacterium]
MIRLLTVLLLVTISSAALSTTLYRWVDEDGRVHFSDQPREGAEQVTVRSPSTFEAPKAPPKRSTASTTAAEAEEEEFQYNSLAVVSPASEQTLWNIAGRLSVSVSIAPGLAQGHTMRANIDGRSVNVGAATSFVLTEVYRGEHAVSVSVIDSTGREMIRSAPVRFFVQQTNVGN